MEHKMWGVASTGNRWWPDQPESSARGAATRPEANEPMSVEHPIVPEKDTRYQAPGIGYTTRNLRNGQPFLLIL